ncbi:FAD/NAD(P)-binding domain-containing protein [Lophium mytilinum]|uniref:FAD/NAD(P)-binding domain-containing protein n=1 Tax=Lophium mytilinum TaxID=390894 RepID=A0A6A6QC03_9PEZI|nr:FAD/NAD(P)-binding domain-containing protein [Lophium mytilinum]
MHLPDVSHDSVPGLGHATTRLPHRILIVGGAYGGLMAALNLLSLAKGNTNRPSAYPLPDLQKRMSRRGVHITVLDQRDGIFHSVGAPLAHVSEKSSPVMWKPFKSFPELQHPNLSFEQGSLTKIDCKSRIAWYTDIHGILQEEPYHYLIQATGLKRNWPIVPRAQSCNEYNKDASTLIIQIKNARHKRVAVVGGGAVGIEFAGEVKHNHPGLHVTLIHSRAELLSAEPLPAEFKYRAKILLEDLGVEVITGNRATVEEQSEGHYLVTLTNGKTITAGAVINATAKHLPTTDCLPREAVDEEGYVRVTPTLAFPTSVPNSAAHYAIGDVCAWSGIRRAGGAMVMGQLAATNLFASILTSEDPNFTPEHAELPEFPAVMGLAVGDQAIVYSAGTGVEWGKKTMEVMFGEDLGWNCEFASIGCEAVDLS